MPRGSTSFRIRAVTATGPTRRDLYAVCAGGFVGAIARGVVSEQLTHAPDAWPWATFLVNLAGSFVLGYVVVRVQHRLDPRRLFVGVGVCGALTTFSTMQLETLRMLDAHAYALAAVYVVVSVVLGLACIVGAGKVARRGLPA
jgi:CrcB protein